MTDLLPPYHKPMTSQLDCDLANDRIAALEAENEALRREAERLKWMLVRSVCDECLVHKGGAGSEEEGEDCPPVRDALADLAARYDPCHFTPSRWQRRES